MKFDFAIGNPPYQEQMSGDNLNYAPPIYDRFIDAAASIADKVELIHPARFLFNAGSTSKAWNEKMLKNPHFKVLHYEPNSSKIFANTEITGGVVISYMDKDEDFGSIGVFTPYEELNGILKKVAPSKEEDSLMSIIYLQAKFDLDALYADHPDLKSIVGSDGKDKRFRNNIFEKIHLFSEARVSDDDVSVIGVLKNKRVWRFIPKRYLDEGDDNTYGYKTLVVRVNGAGKLGEVLSSPFVAKPGETYTQTFIGIGNFKTEEEANNALKYVKTKFARIMLGVLKVTQDNNRDVWRMIPLQDFSKSSKINWFADVDAIDEQLFDLYKLTDEEKNFIRNTGKEMV